MRSMLYCVWLEAYMKTKEKILELFECNKGIYFSGEELAQKLSVSRAAVWKAVKGLQGEGYQIDAVPNRGYCMSERTDILSPQGIQKYLELICAELELQIFPNVTSTMALAREKAVEGVQEGYVVLANEQSAGRGRRGRSFASPRGTGVYMSLLLRPTHYAAAQAVRITTIAAVAMCEAIEAVSEETAQIKWVNDIFVRGKKVCGILTEAALGMESGMLEYAILGVGINVYQPVGGFPKELEQIVGTVFDTAQNDMKNHLAAEFLNHFMAYYTSLEHADYAEEYRKRSLAIGRQVSVLSGAESRKAMVLGVDDECQLLVRYEDGTQEALSSGEISIRL